VRTIYPPVKTTSAAAKKDETEKPPDVSKHDDTSNRKPRKNAKKNKSKEPSDETVSSGSDADGVPAVNVAAAGKKKRAPRKKAAAHKVICEPPEKQKDEGTVSERDGLEGAPGVAANHKPSKVGVSSCAAEAECSDSDEFAELVIADCSPPPVLLDRFGKRRNTKRNRVDSSETDDGTYESRLRVLNTITRAVAATADNEYGKNQDSEGEDDMPMLEQAGEEGEVQVAAESAIESDSAEEFVFDLELIEPPPWKNSVSRKYIYIFIVLFLKLLFSCFIELDSIVIFFVFLIFKFNFFYISFLCI